MVEQFATPARSLDGSAAAVAAEPLAQAGASSTPRVPGAHAGLPRFDFCAPSIAPGRLHARLATTLGQGRRTIQTRFEASGDAECVLRHHCQLVDDLVRALLDVAARRLPAATRASLARRFVVVAGGGYGRGELHPHSDLDLIFVTIGMRAGPVVRFLLHTLWDLGFAVRHAACSIDDCLAAAREDRRLRTRLLDARRLWGSEGLFGELSERFAAQVLVPSGPRYLRASVQEMLRRRHQFAPAGGVAEPNVKLGKGGLRDLHALHWMHQMHTRVAAIEPAQQASWQGTFKRFAGLRHFLWNVRCHLHYLTDRPEDRLCLELQPRVARRMAFGDGHRGFMQRYGGISEEVCALFEDCVRELRLAA